MNVRPLVGLLLVSVFLAACVVRNMPQAEPLAPMSSVDTPVKAHLVDGTVVVFQEGARYASDSLYGSGVHYGLGLEVLEARLAVPLDSVLGVEAFSATVNPAATALLTTMGVGLGVVGGAALHVAIFGSCPTVYASTSPDAPMEAELFSHSIVPLAEARDVDRLGVSGDVERVTLDIRNEALETHFINHLELLAIDHRLDEWVLNDGSGQPLAAGDWIEASSITDRDGRDVRGLVSGVDDRVFETQPARLERADLEDFADHLVLDVTRPAADSAAVVLRMRNSLLNTVLLYDFMLAPAGLEAADWLGGTLERLGTAVEMGRWYQSRMGMRVEVWDDGAFRPAGRVSDTGPLAWEDVALVVPVPDDEPRLRVRLSFLADQWRIDRIRVAGSVRRPEMRVVPLAAVLDHEGRPLPDAHQAAAHPDERYLETRPGVVVQAVFEPGPTDGPRTFLLAAQGYYTEWLRPDWVRTGAPAEPFVASDETLMATLDRWRNVKSEFESRFYDTRIPTRQEQP